MLVEPKQFACLVGLLAVWLATPLCTHQVVFYCQCIARSRQIEIAMIANAWKENLSGVREKERKTEKVFTDKGCVRINLLSMQCRKQKNRKYNDKSLSGFKKKKRFSGVQREGEAVRGVCVRAWRINDDEA